MTDDPWDVRVAGEFVAGQQYELVAADDEGGVVVIDQRRHAVARLPLTPGGEVHTRTGRWLIAAERTGRGWAVVARDPGSAAPFGVAYPRWLPGYKLWIAPDHTYRLGKNLLTDSWAIRDGRQAIGRYQTHSLTHVTIDVAEALRPVPQLALLMVLGLETARYDWTVPRTASPSTPH